jgi:cardiolipin synthase
VRVILQNINTFGNHPNQKAYDFLKNQGVPVRWAREYFALTHQKTLITDGTQAFIMTFNFTPQYYRTSRDFGVIDSDPQDIAAIVATFNADWEGRSIHPSAGKDLVWSPGSADTLLALIKSATKTLDIYSLEVEDERINTALKEAAGRGVTIRLNMTYGTTWKKALNDLDASGVHIKTFPSTATSFFIHAKAVIADGKRLFIGSENFSGQSLDSNRELGILISKTDIIASVQQTFEKDWRVSRPYGKSVLGTSSSGGESAEGVIKKSKSGICHPPGSGSYNQTKNFTAYTTIEECLASGGRLPATYSK